MVPVHRRGSLRRSHSGLASFPHLREPRLAPAWASRRSGGGSSDTPYMPIDQRFRLNAGRGQFEGENALALSGAFRLNPNFQLEGGVGFGVDHSTFGARRRHAHLVGSCGRELVKADAYFGRRLPLVAAAFLFAAGLVGPAAAQAPIPDAQRAEFMVKTTIVALNHANLTGNYTVLRDLGSPRFRNINNAARLAGVFTPLRERGINLSPVVVFEPVLTEPVSSDGQGRLKLVGYFPTRPLRVVFDLAYEPIQNRWLISDIAVNLAPWPGEAAEEGAQAQDGGEEAAGPRDGAPQ